MNDPHSEQDPRELQPEATGSTNEQDRGTASQALVRSGDAVDRSHVGALLTEYAASERVFHRAVALAALNDAEASRRFVENQLSSSQEQNLDLRETLRTQSIALAVLRTQMAVVSAVQRPQQIVFGLGAAIFGGGLGGAFTSSFGMIHLLAIIVGVVLMGVGSLNLTVRETGQ